MLDDKKSNNWTMEEVYKIELDLMIIINKTSF